MILEPTSIRQLAGTRTLLDSFCSSQARAGVLYASVASPRPKGPRLCTILGNTVALIVQEAKVIAASHISAVTGLLIEGARLRVVPGRAVSAIVKPTKTVADVRYTAATGFLIKHERLGIVFGDALAVIVKSAKAGASG